MDLSALFWNYEPSISITGDVLRCFLFLFVLSATECKFFSLNYIEKTFTYLTSLQMLT